MAYRCRTHRGECGLTSWVRRKASACRLCRVLEFMNPLHLQVRHDLAVTGGESFLHPAAETALH